MTTDATPGLHQVTMIDVAREAGVSRAAVSKVIRSAYGVSDEMRRRVEAAVDRLGYRPNMAARAIRGTSFTIGFELHEVLNPAIARIMAGAVEAAAGAGYQLIVAPAESAASETGARSLEALVDLRVDGIVAVSPLTPKTTLERLSLSMPLVTLARHDQASGYDTMTGDDVAGTILALDHLSALGHRRIGHLTRKNPADAYEHQTPFVIREAAYRSWMREHVPGARPIVEYASYPDEIGAAADRILDLGKHRPTAVFAASDQIALILLDRMAQRGLGPADVSVVGYDNVPIAEHAGVSLTTVDQSGGILGKRATELLIERLRGRTEARHESTVPELKVRTSTRPITGSAGPRAAARLR